MKEDKDEPQILRTLISSTEHKEFFSKENYIQCYTNACKVMFVFLLLPLF